MNYEKLSRKKEYLVQVTIIEARFLVAKDDGSSNPFVKMTCSNLPVQATELVERNLSPVWNQSFTFSGLELTEQEFQTSELQFQVCSKNNFFGNDLIGEYAINLSTLYKNANHEYYNVWLCLTNPEEEEETDSAQGYLLIDCFIIAEGDRPPVHSINDKLNTDVEEDDEEFNIDSLNFEQLREYQEKKMGIQVLGKPSVARKAFQLCSYVLKADSLIDFPGVFNPVKPNFFVSCRAMGLVHRTKSGTSNAPLIYQKLLFPTYFPFLNDKIVMRAWHYQKGGQDKFIANIPEFTSNNDFFNISKLMSMGGRMAAKWINLYGIPPLERNDQISGRRKHPLSGTAFLGRVQISFALIANPSPTYDIVACHPFYEPDTQTYRLYCDVYQCKFLKDYDIQVWCEASIGVYKTGPSKKKKPNKKDVVEWKKDDEKNEICLPSIIQNFPKDINSVPDIFLNLITGDGSKEERIGYIRLKAEKVLNWEALPRWLPFNSLDVTKDSPGSVLTNLSFMIETENTKRIFKQRGISSYFNLYAHIVHGFELDSKSGDTEIETLIEIDVDGKTSRTEVKSGRFPFWNNLLKIEVELDSKLDFAPDIAVTLYKKSPKKFLQDEKLEPIGQFTVPIWCCKKKKTLPHFFNFIKNNESIGRVCAMFFIEQQNKKKPKQQVFEIYEALKKTYICDVQVSILGLRNLDFETKLQDIDFTVSITQDEQENLQLNKLQEDKQELDKINNTEEKENFLNFLQIYEFKDVKIYGDSVFQIYPLMKIDLVKKSFFGNEQRYLLFNLSEYSNTISERTKKKYKVMFECNLGETSINQEQVILTELGEKVEEAKEEKGLGEDYDEDEEQNTQRNKEEVALRLKELQEEDEDEFDESLDKKLVVKLETYKNCEISDIIELSCMPKDKNNEKEVKKILRKNIFLQMKEIKKLDFLDEKETEKLLDLTQKYRELKKPLMNEDIFYGFDDLADEYDYGRDIYREDVYETHPDLKIPFQTKKLMYIPQGIFEDKYEKMEGYYRLGKETECLIKFNVNLNIKNLSKEEEEEKAKADAKAEKKRKKNKKIENENEEDEEIKKELNKYNIYNSIFNTRLKNSYANKRTRKELRKDQICFPMNSVRVRVYILRALNLTAQDNYSTLLNVLSGYSAYCRANSYIEIKLGHKYDTDDNKVIKYIKDETSLMPNTLNPDFFKSYELEGDLPQDWKLTINIRSKKDGQIGDGSLIGSTTIDVEDRYIGENKNVMTLAYKSYEDVLNKEIETGDENEIGKRLTTISNKLDALVSKQIPVEYRPLHHPEKRTAQGILEMFVEVLSQQQAKLVKPAKIERPPPQEYELRLVIWECKNLFLEERQKTISVYITCSYRPEGWLSEVSLFM